MSPVITPNPIPIPSEIKLPAIWIPACPLYDLSNGVKLMYCW